MYLFKKSEAQNHFNWKNKLIQMYSILLSNNNNNNKEDRFHSSIMETERKKFRSNLRPPLRRGKILGRKEVDRDKSNATARWVNR